MLILGISCDFHDSAACLLRNGQLVAAAAEERFTRHKHTAEFPLQAIRFCLRRAGIRPADLDYAVFYEKPLLKLERLLLTILGEAPRSFDLFRQAMPLWIREKVWVQARIQRELGLPLDRILFTEHHLAHAASAFYCSPYKEAAVLTADGVGEWATTALGAGYENRLCLTREIRFPHSIGLLYSAFTAHLGFAVNDGEYKVMGLAAYGRPCYAEQVYKLLEIAADGSFRLRPEYFAFPYSTRSMVTDRFTELFGPPRPLGDAAEVTRHHMDLAASVQLVTEELMLGLARSLHRETGLDALCLAGGVALNGVANHRLRREGPFRSLYIQPAAGDAGGALGAALYVHHQLLGNPRSLVLDRVDWGAWWEDEEIAAWLTREGVAFTRLEREEDLLDAVAAELAAGRVAGWMQGRFEWGPRALGHRSILADPRRAEMKETVNRRIKFREPFRPFAPSVQAEQAAELFDLGDCADDLPLRFMLYVTPVRDDRIPAVTHVDGSARPQLVDPQISPRFHQLLGRFADLTGVPALLNTSFNRRGEPIVASPADALLTFRSTDLDLLVLGNCLIRA